MNTKLTPAEEQSRRVTEAAAHAILRYAHRWPDITPEGLRQQSRAKAYDGWMSLLEVRLCNMAQWQAAMDSAADLLEQKGRPMSAVSLAELLECAVAQGSAEEADVALFERVLSTGTFLGWSEEFGRVMKRIRLNTWVCTDTEVGFCAFQFRGEVVAVSWQSARKSDVEMHWLSRDAALQVRTFIRELDERREPLDIQLIDVNAPVLAHWVEPRNAQR